MKVDKSKWVSCTLDSVCDIQFGTRIVKKQTEAGQYYVYGGNYSAKGHGGVSSLK